MFGPSLTVAGIIRFLNDLAAWVGFVSIIISTTATVLRLVVLWLEERNRERNREPTALSSEDQIDYESDWDLEVHHSD